MEFKAPFFRYDDLRRYAETFLSEYHSSRSIPIPIEDIVDLRLGIDIVPMPGLSNFNTVAYISPDLKEIRVDEFIYSQRPNRYRFSLAHEIGHRVLHADIFQQFKFSDVASWIRFMTDVSHLEQYSYLEKHADSFAGLTLVPAAELEKTFFDYVEKAEEHGIDFDEPGTGAREVVEEQIARVFEVSTQVVHIRIEFDGLWHSDS